MRNILFSAASAGAFIGVILFTAQEADARGFGGGARGGGATSMSRGGGGGSFSRAGNYSRPSGGTFAGQLPARDRNNINRGNINTGNINRANINVGNNVNIDRDVHVDVDNDWNGWHGYYDHPNGAYAAGVVVGAAVTAAVIGSRYYALPAGCSPYPYSGFTYYSCSNVWYKPTYQGSTVVYVVVAKPY